MASKLNPNWEEARSWAQEYGNDSVETIKRFMRELKVLRLALVNTKITLEIARLAWRQLRSPEGIKGWSVPDAVPTTLLKGSPRYIDKYLSSIKENMPDIYDSTAHDKYVEANAEVLKAIGWTYKATGIGGRLSKERVEELGL